MILRKTLASLLVTLSAATAGANTLETKLPPPTEIQCFELDEKNKPVCPAAKKDDLQLRIEQGISYSDNNSYSGFATGFTNKNMTIKLGFDEERIKERTDEELEIVGLRIEGRETLHRYKFWFGVAGNWWNFQRNYVDLQTTLQVTGGMHFEFRTLNPDESPDNLPTEVKIKPFFRVGGEFSAIYPLSHFTNFPVIKNLGAGVNFAAGFQNIDLIGATESRYGLYFGANLLATYSL